MTDTSNDTGGAEDPVADIGRGRVDYARMAGDLYNLCGLQGTRWIEMANAMAPHLPTAMREELQAAVDQYCGGLTARMAQIADGLFPGPRVPDGTRLVWALEDLDEDGGLSGLFDTQELAQDAKATAGQDVYPHLVFSRPERRVDFVERVVLLRHHHTGWWVQSDQVRHMENYVESAYPLAHVDPELTVGEHPTSSRATICAVLAGADRRPDLDRAVQAALDERWPDLLPADPDRAVIA